MSYGARDLEVRGRDIKSVRVFECHQLAGGSFVGLLTGVSLALLAVFIIVCSRKCRSNNKTVDEMEMEVFQSKMAVFWA